MAVFANILKTLRTDKHLSQQELATRLGISKSAVSMYEQGRREPDVVHSLMNPNLSRLPHTLIPLTLRRLSWMMLKNTFNLSVQKENNKGAFRNGYAKQI